MKVYIVQGTCGEYSDRSEWLVAAYFDQKHAAEHVALCSAWFREQNGTATWRTPCPYDARFSTDYTGTQWNLLEVELYGVPPRTVTP